ncbi:Retrotransposon protein, Ty1-Copia subclass [Phytophthora megakarya]|uniref:Retrotransposon protein, Ty1-Copia subclass n=1 Tax=Phytophthora megakarya TaxID=4795 RepID=A0A225WKH0_9STRA|nr:Retrotransposon protein, Ty1-Copia subclass [Phytophthora megakarya]
MLWIQNASRHNNLVSQERLEQDGWETSTAPPPTPEDRVTYFTNAFYPDVKLVFKKRHGHYWLDATPVHGENSVCAMTSSGTNHKVLMWHMKLGHLNIQAIKKMVELDMVEGMEALTLKAFRCIACQQAKQKRMSYKRLQKRRKECYARLMSDVCNVGIVTRGGNIYFQLIQNEASRYKWIFGWKPRLKLLIM